MAATEIVWFEDDPPAEARAWWETEYAAIGDIGQNIRMIEEGGFDLLGHFTLPESAWWNYYQPSRASAVDERGVGLTVRRRSEERARPAQAAYRASQQKDGE